MKKEKNKQICCVLLADSTVSRPFLSPLLVFLQLFSVNRATVCWFVSGDQVVADQLQCSSVRETRLRCDRLLTPQEARHMERSRLISKEVDLFEQKHGNHSERRLLKAWKISEIRRKDVRNVRDT